MMGRATAPVTSCQRPFIAHSLTARAKSTQLTDHTGERLAIAHATQTAANTTASARTDQARTGTGEGAKTIGDAALNFSHMPAVDLPDKGAVVTLGRWPARSA